MIRPADNAQQLTPNFPHKNTKSLWGGVFSLYIVRL